MKAFRGQIMHEWRELRFWYAKRISMDELYEYKRDEILPALEGNGIELFLCLDEAEYMVLRTCS